MLRFITELEKISLVALQQHAYWLLAICHKYLGRVLMTPKPDVNIWDDALELLVKNHVDSGLLVVHSPDVLMHRE